MQIMDLDGKTYDVKLRSRDPQACEAKVLRQYEVCDEGADAGRLIVAGDGLHRSIRMTRPEVFNRVVDGFLKARRRMGDQRCDFLESVAQVVDELEAGPRPDGDLMVHRANVELLEALLDYTRTWSQWPLVAYEAASARGSKATRTKFVILRGEDRFREVRPGQSSDGVEGVRSVRPEDVLRVVARPESLLAHLARQIPVETSTAQAVETLHSAARLLTEAREKAQRADSTH